MKRNWSQITIMLSGAFLVLFGVGVIAFQLIAQYAVGTGTTAYLAMPQSMSASPKGFVATTHYVGLEIVMVGAVLEIVGFVGDSYSKNRSSLTEGKKALLSD